MPRNPSLSLEIKKIIWKNAAGLGKDDLAGIRRQLGIDMGRLSDDLADFEDTPDTRTIKKTIEEINELTPEFVICELPKSVWSLRNDYQELLASGQPSSHCRVLYRFGQHLRDRILDEIPQSQRLSFQHETTDSFAFWTREKNIPKDVDEEESDLEWGLPLLFGSEYNAGPHPLYGLFRSHLSSHRCWEILDKIKQFNSNHIEACSDSYKEIMKELDKISNRATTEGRAKIASRILLHAEHGSKISGVFPELHYSQKELDQAVVINPEGDQEYPAINKEILLRHQIDFDSMDLAEIEQCLTSILPDISFWFNVVCVCEFGYKCLVQQFKRSLYPEGRLMEWIKAGHCIQCSGTSQIVTQQPSQVTEEGLD